MNSHDHPARWSHPLIPNWWDYSGFGYGKGGTRGGHAVYQLALPYWFLVFTFAALLYVAATRRKRSGGKEGHCASCGYDLRGSGDACPECGAMKGADKR